MWQGIMRLAMPASHSWVSIAGFLIGRIGTTRTKPLVAEQYLTCMYNRNRYVMRGRVGLFTTPEIEIYGYQVCMLLPLLQMRGDRATIPMVSLLQLHYPRLSLHLIMT